MTPCPFLYHYVEIEALHRIKRRVKAEIKRRRETPINLLVKRASLQIQIAAERAIIPDLWEPGFRTPTHFDETRAMLTYQARRPVDFVNLAVIDFAPGTTDESRVRVHEIPRQPE